MLMIELPQPTAQLAHQCTYPLRNLLTSVRNLVPCDRVMQRVYYFYEV